MSQPKSALSRFSTRAARLARSLGRQLGLSRSALIASEPSLGLWAFPVNIDQAGRGLWAIGPRKADGSAELWRCFPARAHWGPIEAGLIPASAELYAEMAQPAEPGQNAHSSSAARINQNDKAGRAGGPWVIREDQAPLSKRRGAINGPEILNALALTLAQRLLDGAAPAPFELRSALFGAGPKREEALAFCSRAMEMGPRFKDPAWRVFSGSQKGYWMLDAALVGVDNHTAPVSWSSMARAPSGPIHITPPAISDIALNQSRYWLCVSVGETTPFLVHERVRASKGSPHCPRVLQRSLWINQREVFDLAALASGDELEISLDDPLFFLCGANAWAGSRLLCALRSGSQSPQSSRLTHTVPLGLDYDFDPLVSLSRQAAELTDLGAREPASAETLSRAQALELSLALRPRRAELTSPPPLAPSPRRGL